MLSLADVWCAWAESALGNSDSFYNPDNGITPETVGKVSPYHTASGVHAVRVFISHAMGDFLSCRAALSAFISASKGPCENLDLTLGRSGTLLVSSLLLELSHGGALSDRTSLLEFGSETFQDVWQKVNRLPPMRECPEITYLGIAHGWAGILYATLCWCRSSGAELPRSLEERLQELARCGESVGLGSRWPWVISTAKRERENFMPGWCNGSAGYVFIWTAAYRTLRDKRYLELAEKAAWNVWESRDSINNLCCGLAGQAYALLNLYKETGNQTWLVRAKMLAVRASSHREARPGSLTPTLKAFTKGE